MARYSEEKTDNILDGVEEEVQEIDPEAEMRKERTKKEIEEEEDIRARERRREKEDNERVEETVQKILKKAGSHMEYTLIGTTFSVYLNIEKF